MKTHSVLATMLVGCAATLLSVQSAVSAPETPPQAQIDFASQTSDLLLATLFAALLQEFAETTPANVAQGKQSISLIFNDKNDAMRLIGEQQPLQANNVPQDDFEENALAQAMIGQAFTSVERVKGKWYYRRSVPLSNFHPSCGMCHTNFGSTNPTQWVGALMLRVPIGN